MKEYINVTVGDYEIKTEKNTRLITLAGRYSHTCKYPILLAKVDNQLEELNKKLASDCHVEFLDITDPNGYRTYQRTTSFLMICAAKEILGTDTRVIVEHSINKNYYCIVEKDGLTLTEEIIASIEQRMWELVSKDIVIERISIPTEEGTGIASEMGLPDKEALLKYRRTANVNFYRMGWFYNYFYGKIAPSTGYLKIFKLVKSSEGFLLLFPDSSNPNTLNEIKPHDKLFKIFSESSKWAKIMNVDTVSALNDVICSQSAMNIIRVNEALHEKKISNIADAIHERGKKIVLIAGPSSSGKTTFANRLSIQLAAGGLHPHIISLDDYYLERSLVPLDEFGQPDFEALEALDIAQFNKDISLLMNGELVNLPKFNFISGKREYRRHALKMGADDVLVVEGIHGLNKAVGSSISDDLKFSIFISALTQLNIDDHNRIPTSDTRLIRRLVRDIRHRGVLPATTISMWPSVARGEAKHIFPHQERADAMFNSALVYELCVLKTFVEPLLFGVEKDQPEFTEARRLLKFMDSFLSISPEEVPKNSILREFIGGSSFF